MEHFKAGILLSVDTAPGPFATPGCLHVSLMSGLPVTNTCPPNSRFPHIYLTYQPSTLLEGRLSENGQRSTLSHYSDALPWGEAAAPREKFLWAHSLPQCFSTHNQPHLSSKCKPLPGSMAYRLAQDGVAAMKNMAPQRGGQ